MDRVESDNDSIDNGVDSEKGGSSKTHFELILSLRMSLLLYLLWKMLSWMDQ